MPTFQEQIEDLEEEVKKLENRRSEVGRRPKEVDDQAIDSTQQYDEWDKKAKEIITNSYAFIKEVRNPHSKCFSKLWYDKPYQNKISQEAANLRKAVNNHYGEMQSDEAETPSTLENLSHRIEIRSRDNLLGDILNYLQDDEVNTIGLYGTAGVGKTVMVEKIIRQVENEKLFDVVVKATAPRVPNIMSIQNQIAEKMKIKFDAMKTIEQRADQLSHALLMKRDNKEKVLVILEDIGRNFGFAAQVVFLLEARCKLVITSRFKDLLTIGPMKADRIINLKVLDKEEARDLFLKTLRAEDNSQLECLLEYCGGLPLAIVTIASALREKNNYHWKYAVDLLNDHFDEKTGRVYNRAPEIIELSFYYLQDKVAQLLLLFCCLYPKETPIEVERLMGYCLGMHLFEANCSLENAMFRLYGSLTRLISCNFLSTMEDTDGAYCVQMSDAVRQVAICIASREEYNFLVDPCWRMGEEQTSKYAISQCIKFKENENDKEDSGDLERQFVNLEIFCVWYTSIEDNKIQLDGFFKGKELLKVLDICCRYTVLDLNSQLHPLGNLRSLRLIASKVKGLSEIGQLTSLEYLYIAVDSMKELPTTFDKLTQLQVLDLSRSGLLQIIPAKVLGSLSKLKGLLLNTRVTHSVIRILFPRINLLELKSCRHLEVLEAVLTVSDDPQMLQTISEVETVLSLLLSFKLIISSNPTRGKWGDGFDDIERKGLNKLFPKALHFHHINISSPIKFQEMSSLWKNLQLLCCMKVEGLHEIQDKFLRLRVLLLSRCEDIKYLAKRDLKFTKLEFLVLQRLPNLERICEQEALWKDRFPGLREIYLEDLPNMKYNPSWSSDTSSVQYLFGAEDDLKNVELVSITSLKCEDIWHFPAPVDSFSRLQTIKIYKMPELRSLFPSLIFCTKLLQKVQTLDIRLCEKLEAVILEAEEIDEDDADMSNINISVIPKLEKMSLLTLPSLRWFYKGRRTLKFPALQRVYLGHCPTMESFTTARTPLTPRLTDNKGIKIGDINQLVNGKY